MNPLFLWFHKLGSPPYFYRFAGWWLPWLYGFAAISGIAGLYGGLAMAPADYQQGDSFRIIYIHAPCAWMSLFGYIFMLEGLSVAHGAWIYERVTQAHGKEAASFVKLHANEDEDHMEKAFDVVSQLGERELGLIRENYLFTCSIYRLFLEAAGSKAG